MQFEFARHVLPQESVHPSPELATLTPRARQVNWEVVASGKVAQRISNLDLDGDVIPLHVQEAARREVLGILPLMDLDHLDACVDRVARAAKSAFRASKGMVYADAVRRAVTDAAHSAAEEIKSEYCAQAMQAS